MPKLPIGNGQLGHSQVAHVQLGHPQVAHVQLGTFQDMGDFKQNEHNWPHMAPFEKVIVSPSRKSQGGANGTPGPPTLHKWPLMGPLGLA